MGKPRDMLKQDTDRLGATEKDLSAVAGRHTQNRFFVDEVEGELGGPVRGDAAMILENPASSKFEPGWSTLPQPELESSMPGMESSDSPDPIELESERKRTA